MRSLRAGHVGEAGAWDPRRQGRPLPEHSCPTKSAHGDVSKAIAGHIQATVHRHAEVAELVGHRCGSDVLWRERRKALGREKRVLWM